MISQESLWCAIMQYPGTWLPGPEHQNHWRRCFAILPEAGHETIVWRITLVSIKNGKMALHWYWRSVNWRSECLKLLLYIGVCVLSSIGESFNLAIYTEFAKSPIKNLTTVSRYTVSIRPWQYLAFEGCKKEGLVYQGVVTYIPAVLTPATGIKVRTSGQAIKLEMIKRSRCLFALLNQGQDGSYPLTPPTPCSPPVGNQGSRLF